MVEAHGIKPGKALEVGCGTGTNAIWLAKHGFDVTGLEIYRKKHGLLSADEIRAIRASRSRRWRRDPADFIAGWRAHTRWSTDEQVEQDLVLCRALVEIFDDAELAWD